MEKVKLSEATKAITDLAKEELSEDQLRKLEDVFREVAYGEITLTVVAGEIENIKVIKNYKPVVDKTE